jgi:predicted transcriptional regulator
MATRRKLASGELENQVLNALWSGGDPMTPGEVHEVVAADHRLAYTTVMTILTRLCDKGLLTRHKQGRAFAYQPVVGRDERVAQRMQEVLDAAEDRVAALSTFITALPADQRSALRSALERGAGEA